VIPAAVSGARPLANAANPTLRGRRVAMVSFSHYPSDPRPRRAAEALVRAGMAVDVICIRQTWREPRRETCGGVRVVRLPLTHHRGGKVGYVGRYGSFLLAVLVTLALRSLRRRYDLVYVHTMPDVLVFGALGPKALGAKVILDVHDPMPELLVTIFGADPGARTVRLLKRLEKWSIALADRVVTVNEACRRLFVSRSCPPEKIDVVMNAPDEALFPANAAARAAIPRPCAGRPFVLMYHGALVERNGVDIAVDALGRARRTIADAQLRIYGQPTPFIDRVLASARAQGLAGAVQFMGPRRLEEIAPAIAACDVGVIPSRRSPFAELSTPTRVFEYLALGKPVVAPRGVGTLDYFDENALLFFEPGSAEDLARKIEHVYLCPDEVRDVVARGQAVYRAHAWDGERARLVEFVAHALEDRRPVAAGRGR
jgi:glycosyltransferase involved in cell wall biosynthesis